MEFLRRWFLIWFALVLSGASLFAADSRETRTYAAALDAFHDQFYDRAEVGLTQFLHSYRKSTNAPAAMLLLAQSEFYLGKFPEAITHLTDPGNRERAKAAGLLDRYVYWTAEAQFGKGDFKAAAETYLSLRTNFPESPLGISAVVAAAAAYDKLGEWAQVDDLLGSTNGIFQFTAQLDPASEPVINGRLLQSESKIEQKDFAAAIQVLNLLIPVALTPNQDWKRSHQLGRAYLGLNDVDAALAASTNLLQIARQGQGDAWPARLAESVAFHASLLETKGRLDEALVAWQENLTNGVPGAQQQQAVLKIAQLAAAQHDYVDAEAGLQNFPTQFPNSPAVEIALLTLGELHLKEFVSEPDTTNQLAVAQANFDQLLTLATNGSLAGKAFLDRGWCRWLAGNRAESLDDFSSAAKLLPPSPDQAVAKFKMGDACFAKKDFAGARANYESVLNDYANQPAIGHALGELALYQSLRANLALNDAAGADANLARILKIYPEGDLSDNAILLVAESADDARRPAVARKLLEQFERQFPKSELLPQARMAVAHTYEQEQNWPDAITNYEGWLQDFPTNILRPQIEYSLALANYQAGNETNALAQFNAFIQESPTNALAPLAHWWVADHYFRLGGTNLVEAEQNYELIFQDFPNDQLAYPAQMMAGRSAMGRFSYTDASRSYFIPLINDTNCPPELALQARFAYSAALMQMATSETNNVSLQLATNILNQICESYPTNEAGALAWAELGDCNLQLGALDDATNAYAQVFDTNSPASAAASLDLANRARVGVGIVLEKKAEGLPDDDRADRKILLAQALNYYLDVVYSQADEFWIKKAGLQALPLITSSSDAKKLNLFFDRLEELLPQWKDALELKRAALKD